MFALETARDSLGRQMLQPNRVKVFQSVKTARTKRPFTVDGSRSTHRASAQRITAKISQKSNLIGKTSSSVKFESPRTCGNESRSKTPTFYLESDESSLDSDSEPEQLGFGDIFAQLNNEIETSRIYNRSGLIDQMSKSCLITLNSLPVDTGNRKASRAQTAIEGNHNSRRPSILGNRPSSGLEAVRTRVAENISQGFGGRPPSVASIFSNEDNFSDGDPTTTSRSERGTVSTSVNTSMYAHALSSAGSRKVKGALEGVKPCKRMESVLNEDLSAVVNDLSRQCCDVLGPDLCSECVKNVKRFNNFLAYHNKHPDIDETAMTLYAIPLIQRMMPGLSRHEIKFKLASGEISQTLKLKVNRSKDIEEFADKVTDYFPEKRKRSRMRKQRIESGRGVNKVEGHDEYFVLPFNPGAYLDTRGFSRKGSRRNALFPTEFMASGASTPSDIHDMSRLPTPEPRMPSPESNPEEQQQVVDFGPCQPTLMDLKWARDFPRFFAGYQQQYTLPVWRRSDLPPDP